MAMPANLREAVERTPWERWRGEEVLLSATHDPYLLISKLIRKSAAFFVKYP